MTADEFSEALCALVGGAEEDGLERPAMIAVLLAQAEADGAGPAPEARPDGFVEALGQLLADAEAAGPKRAPVGAMLLDRAEAE